MCIIYCMCSMCVCVLLCMCVCVCVCVYVCVCVCVCVCVRVCVHVHVCSVCVVFVRVCLHAFVYVQAYVVCPGTCRCAYMCVAHLCFIDTLISSSSTYTNQLSHTAHYILCQHYQNTKPPSIAQSSHVADISHAKE